MGFLQSIFSGGTSKVVNAVGGVVDKLVTTKEEKMWLENDIRKAKLQYEMEMRKMDIEEKDRCLAILKTPVQ